MKLGFGIDEGIETAASLRVPVAAVAAIAFDLVQAGMQPTEERIRLIELSN